MLLNEIFEKAPAITVRHLAVDSRMPNEDGIFFCVKGFKNDGHHHVVQAIENGAKVIIYHDEIDTSANAIYIRVEDVTNVLNQVAKRFYGDPSKDMLVYGVTGTNGKTTIASVLKQLTGTKYNSGYIGTIGIMYNDKNLMPSLTTPTILENNRYLSDMANEGVNACAIEVSSIGIEQKRTDSIDFNVGIYTNLTHDHLDYHGNMEEYRKAKKRFFDTLKSDAIAITNLDDQYGLSMVEDCKANVYTYGTGEEADYRAVDVKLDAAKSSFVLKYRGRSLMINTNLVAMFNVYNLLAVLAALDLTGFDLNEIAPLLTDIKPIAGRMHRIDEGQNYNVIVDFAHTPDGLEKVFEYAKAITPSENKIITLFGSAGRRDVIKRKIFGQLADKYCDMIILTEDDPRDESPMDIAKQIAEGITDTQYIIIESREDAIITAIDLLNNKDTLLILGKGDETFIYKNFGREPYKGDDTIARNAIKKRTEEENEII